jgi:glycosyltransferase involved in cell wall biosynthesis
MLFIQKIKYSIIIPAHNEEKFIGECIRSINESAKLLGREVEIIVSLNRCTDNTEDISKSLGAKIVKEDEKNIAKVRNAGASVATGDVIITIDADSRMSPNMFQEIEKLLLSGQFIGGGSKIKLERTSVGIFMSLLVVAPFILFSGVSAGLFWCFRKDFEAIKGFDETLVSAEDVDFAKRLKAYGKTKGLKFGTVSNAHVVTSCRKFDKFGDWYLFLNPGLVWKIFTGTNREAADGFYYDIDR